MKSLESLMMEDLSKRKGDPEKMEENKKMNFADLRNMVKDLDKAVNVIHRIVLQTPQLDHKDINVEILTGCSNCGCAVDIAGLDSVDIKARNGEFDNVVVVFKEKYS